MNAAAPHWASQAGHVFAGWEIFYSLKSNWSGEIDSLHDGKSTRSTKEKIFCVASDRMHDRRESEA